MKSILLIFIFVSTLFPATGHAGILQAFEDAKESFLGNPKLLASLEEQLLKHDTKAAHETMEKIKVSKRDLYVTLFPSFKAIDRFIHYYVLLENANDDDSALELQPSILSSFENIPKKVPFSENFVKEINRHVADVNSKYKEIRTRKKLAKEAERARIEEQRNEARRKREEVETQRAAARVAAAAKEKERQERAAEEARVSVLEKERLERDAIEKQKEVEARQQAEDLASNSKEVRELTLICGICEALESNREIEKALAEDKRYASKYGVVNWGRRDYAVQAIKANDHNILDLKLEYKELVKRPFDAKLCKRKEVNKCDESLEKLHLQLTERYLKQSK